MFMYYTNKEILSMIEKELFENSPNWEKVLVLQEECDIRGI